MDEFDAATYGAVHQEFALDLIVFVACREHSRVTTGVSAKGDGEYILRVLLADLSLYI